MRSSVRVGYGAAGKTSQASTYPTLIASRSVPPHEGEGGIPSSHGVQDHRLAAAADEAARQGAGEFPVVESHLP